MTDSWRVMRRGLIATSVFGALAAVAGRARAADQRSYVLVHGAWHGGWCWRRVSDRLVAEGHRVFCPTLTGLGERVHLLDKSVNISTHIQDVANLIAYENLSDVVLVGHSYGGYVINGVAERLADKIGAIVFLDAFLPQNGETLIEKATSATTRRVINTAIERDDMVINPPPSSAFGVEEGDRPWVDSKLTPQPVSTFKEPAVYTGARDRIARKFYWRAKAQPSPTYDANLARATADGWATHEFTCGHDVMLIQPQQLTELLLRVS